jgi:hypothetical protein
VSVALAVPDQEAGHPFVATISLQNRCDIGVAILTSPVETRVRLSDADRFINETRTTAIYGILYVYATTTDRATAFWPMDGGLAITGEPEFTCLKGASRADLSARAPSGVLRQLPPGHYRAFFRTMAAPSHCNRSLKDIDLLMSVEAYRKLHPSGKKMYQRSHTQLVHSDEVAFWIRGANR